MNYICNCPKSDFSKHNYTYWEDRDTTSDEIEIIDFLENSYKLESKKILHIGIGNSFFAKKFFEYLHKLDNAKYYGIAVAPIKNTGMGIAINDRLKRAASNE